MDNTPRYSYNGNKFYNYSKMHMRMYEEKGYQQNQFISSRDRLGLTRFPKRWVYTHSMSKDLLTAQSLNLETKRFTPTPRTTHVHIPLALGLLEYCDSFTR